jgi:hypothetical protein
MPKLNAVLMVVLAVAVIAATGFLVLRPAPPQPVSAEQYLRKLADADVDVKREGEEGLRKMGPAAVVPLRMASKSSDHVLAVRAAKLLQELQPEPSTPSAGAPTSPSAELDFKFLCSGHPEMPDRSGNFMVEVANRGTTAYRIVLPSTESDWTAAWFEVEDERGRLRKIPAVSMERADRMTVHVLQPGERQLLFRGGGSLMDQVWKPEARAIRFVYDASSEEYRDRAGKSEEGSLLPAAQHASKSLPLNDAR